jgi:uncharacterized membrane protein
MPTPAPPADLASLRVHPFRRAIVRGLGIILPPLLTLVLFIWVWNAIENYVLEPIEAIARHVVVWSIKDIRRNIPDDAELLVANDPKQGFRLGDISYVPTRSNNRYIPRYVRETVDSHIDLTGENDSLPLTPSGYFHQYVRIRYLPRWFVLTTFLIFFIGILYFVGRAFAVGFGRMMVLWLERLVDRVPILRNVYSSVKQVTDFLFSEREIQFTRVVAVEYPRRGIWSLGFVTGESMLDISMAANESVLSVLIPTSPMPVTGYTITVRKSEALDLNITIDQAVQYIVSCGVVVAEHQIQKASRFALANADESKP